MNFVNKPIKRAFWAIAFAATVASAWLAAKFIPHDHGGAKVFEGGDSNADISTKTPIFKVEQDWELEISLNGDFRLARLITADQEVDEYIFSDLFVPGQSGNHIVQPWRTGGEYLVRFEGKGTWQVKVHATSSK